jgi:gamma-glutamyltranspeptidase/glutathione hydrolase
VFQVISNVIDHQLALERAVEHPRVHHQALPDVLFFEPGGLDAETQSELRSLGHQLSEREEWSGDVAAVGFDGTTLRGVADPRRGGAPASARSNGGSGRPTAAGAAAAGSGS